MTMHLNRFAVAKAHRSLAQQIPSVRPRVATDSRRRARTTVRFLVLNGFTDSHNRLEERGAHLHIDKSVLAKVFNDKNTRRSGLNRAGPKNTLS